MIDDYNGESPTKGFPELESLPKQTAVQGTLKGVSPLTVLSRGGKRGGGPNSYQTTTISPRINISVFIPHEEGKLVCKRRNNITQNKARIHNEHSDAKVQNNSMLFVPANRI